MRRKFACQTNCYDATKWGKIANFYGQWGKKQHARAMNELKIQKKKNKRFLME